MKQLFTLLFLSISVSAFSQSNPWEITPNYIKIPSVATLPDCVAGRIVFKTPENKLFTCDGAGWKPLVALQQEGFSAPVKCCKSYPTFPTPIDLDEAEYTYGTGGYSAANDSYTAPSAGTYLISGSFTSATADSSPVNFFMNLFVFKNNTSIRRTGQSNLSSAYNSTVRIDEILLLNAGDVIQLKISHNYTSNLPANVGDGTRLSIVKLN